MKEIEVSGKYCAKTPVALLTRKLGPAFDWTPCVVIRSVQGDQWAKERAQAWIQDFCNQFVEFKNAQWSIEWIASY